MPACGGDETVAPAPGRETGRGGTAGKAGAAGTSGAAGTGAAGSAGAAGSGAAAGNAAGASGSAGSSAGMAGAAGAAGTNGGAGGSSGAAGATAGAGGSAGAAGGAAGAGGSGCVAVAEVCDNGNDDDCDGLVDCNDPSCANGAVCPNTMGEKCNGLDDDADGSVDEGCACTVGTTQPCYPRASLPEACVKGTQTCGGAEWGAAKCEGSVLPAAGEAACCTVLGANPKHALLDAFVAAYPAAAMPKNPSEIANFAPMVNGQAVKYAQTAVANEFVDIKAGGVTTENLSAGRAEVRKKAVALLPAGAVIADTREDPPVVDTPNQAPGCTGRGWAWGSLLAKATDGSVSELVYLYVGQCNPNAGGDAEGFYVSDAPLQVCKAPSKD